MELDHVVVMSDVYMLGCGLEADRNAVIEKALADHDIDPPAGDTSPDAIDVALVDECPEGYVVVYEGPGLPGGKRMAVTPF